MKKEKDLLIEREEHENGYPLKVVCAWCGKEIGHKEGGTEPGGVSHGICKECSEKYSKGSEGNKIE